MWGTPITLIGDIKTWQESCGSWERQSLALSRALGAILLVGLSATASPVDAEAIAGNRVVITAEPGAVITVGDDQFAGPLVLSASDDGLVLTETMSPESYLLGIREVPFAWPDEALKAQAVAARTYLAFTLSGGRTATGSRYGYDICATTACQVYAGRFGLDTFDGQRWAQAVASTAGQILLYNNRPAQALYSSTAGVRTRESEDIFPGLDVPYLAAVASPAEDSPFVSWSFGVSESEMTALLTEAELLHGPIASVGVEQTADGQGPWQVVVSSGRETERMASYRFRSVINRAAAAIMPDRLPAERPDGRRYPQTVLSGTYTISSEQTMVDHGHYRELGRNFVFNGEGWGHQVGMSQFGALALAEDGALYGDILAHYYGGLRPQPAGGWLPPAITVGLVVEVPDLVMLAGQGATVTMDGEEVASGFAAWAFTEVDGRIAAQVPVGIGTAPAIARARLPYGVGGHQLRFDMTAPAFLTVRANIDGETGEVMDLGLAAAGPYEIPLSDLIAAGVTDRARFEVIIEARSPHGDARVVLLGVPERR
ncbi:MAG: SpoIID/LytB domain-containing protein [Acidimicrobiia bacterium]